MIVGVLLICFGVLGLSIWFLTTSISDIGSDRTVSAAANTESTLDQTETEEIMQAETPTIIDAEIVDVIPDESVDERLEDSIEPKPVEPEAEETKKPEDVDDGYLLPSDRKLLTAEDVSHLSASELRIARNEIYARHGRRFQSADLQEYFNQRSWYEGSISPENFDESVLSDIEQKNAEFLSTNTHPLR